MQTKTFVRLQSSRAPYTRGGIRFTSTREPVEIEAGLLSDHQLERLRADPLISVELLDVEIHPGGAETEFRMVQTPTAANGIAPQAEGVTLGGPVPERGVVTTVAAAPLDAQPGAVVEPVIGDQRADAGAPPAPSDIGYQAPTSVPADGFAAPPLGGIVGTVTPTTDGFAAGDAAALDVTTTDAAAAALVVEGAGATGVSAVAPAPETQATAAAIAEDIALAGGLPVIEAMDAVPAGDEGDALAPSKSRAKRAAG